MAATVFKKIEEKIQKVDNLIKEYDSIRDKMYEAADEKYKEKMFSPEYFAANDRYLELCDRFDNHFILIKRSVRSIANDLGFKLKIEKADAKYKCVWESAFNDIKLKFQSTMDMLYRYNYSFSRYWEPVV